MSDARRSGVRALVASLLLALLAAPAFGAVQRTASDAGCTPAPYARVVQLGLAQALPGPAATEPATPTVAGRIDRPLTPRPPCARAAAARRARAPPLRSNG